MPAHSYREETDYLKKIATQWLKKYQFFNGSQLGKIQWTQEFSSHSSSVGIVCNIMNDQPYIRLYYTQTNNYTGEKKDFDYKVMLTTTVCNFGGKRYWFICPLVKNGVPCRRRIGVLYKSGDYFGCRKCQNLIYTSQKINKAYQYYALFRMLGVNKKIDTLQEQIKIPYYNGKPTKKQRKLLKLYRQVNQYYPLLDEIGRL
ncbi:MAG: hypothetical protein A2233_00685 [Candidatus Kerfeldbacteria bacterium RIFOXYA2_FULL_38_24]|nr:MAG: hypothetical protein A2233_00685 [Candidatus Kerfeldbacteria bacterium RIFOXYA2_FULL_38_24]